ncbi:MAG TPA: polysaccharide deacetylase family protein [Candidatus Angelobacter sp.]|nr:polysaccharide deacetylase family protein [Candidatus Angelobacter sp.]
MNGNSVKPAMVLAYHEVMPESNYAYCVTCEDFAGHMALVRSLHKNGAFAATVTFDDGEESQYRNAVPLLAEQGIKATFFVNPGLVGTEAKFLGWEKLQELQAAGHSIQSHGCSHKFLPACSDKELGYELGGSRELLEDKLGTPVEEISVPGGRWDQRVLAACARAGYKRVYVSEPWLNADVCGLEVAGRFMVRRTTTLPELQKMIERDKRALWAMKMRSQLRRGVVSVVGDDLYHRLWCRLTGYDEFEAARQDQSS